jgi:hypothetical protein
MSLQELKAPAAPTSTWTLAAYHAYGRSDAAGAMTKAIMRQDYVTYNNHDGSQRVRCLVTGQDHGGGHFSNRTREVLPDLISSEEDTAEDSDDVPDLIGGEEDTAEDFDDMPDLIPIENNDGGGHCGELSRLYITAKPCPL